MFCISVVPQLGRKFFFILYNEIRQIVKSYPQKYIYGLAQIVCCDKMLFMDNIQAMNSATQQPSPLFTVDVRGANNNNKKNILISLGIVLVVVVSAVFVFKDKKASLSDEDRLKIMQRIQEASANQNISSADLSKISNQVFNASQGQDIPEESKNSITDYINQASR